jgi:RNA polymerase sigma factor (sigma-70 family)
MHNGFDTDPIADEQLVAEALLGEADATETLIRKIAPVLQTAASSFPPQHRQDLEQDAWEKLLRHNWKVLRRWKSLPEPMPLWRYVYAASRNAMLDRLEHMTRDPVASATPDLDIDKALDTTDEDNAAMDALGRCVRRARDRLSETYRLIISLRHDEGLMHRQIAERLGRTMGYVAGTLHRAEHYLQVEMLEECSELLGAFRVSMRVESAERGRHG